MNENQETEHGALSDTARQLRFEMGLSQVVEELIYFNPTGASDEAIANIQFGAEEAISSLFRLFR